MRGASALCGGPLRASDDGAPRVRAVGVLRGAAPRRRDGSSRWASRAVAVTLGRRRHGSATWEQRRHWARAGDPARFWLQKSRASPAGRRRGGRGCDEEGGKRGLRRTLRVSAGGGGSAPLCGLTASPCFAHSVSPGAAGGGDAGRRRDQMARPVLRRGRGEDSGGRARGSGLAAPSTRVNTVSPPSSTSDLPRSKITQRAAR